MLKIVTACAAVLLIATASAAQQPAAPGPAKAPATAEPQAPRGPSANVRVELTITDQRGDAPAASKTIVMLVEDHQLSRIRSGRNSIMLNVDVHPEIVRDGRIRVGLSLEYTPQALDSDRTAPLAVSESLSALLEDGKPLLVSQSADPSSDRKVRVELKATVLK